MLYDKKGRIELKRSYSFKKSNKYWNELSLNHGYIVGYLMNLLEKSKAKTFEQWEAYYFKSGQIRKNLINQISKHNIRNGLLTFDKKIPKKYYKYNTDYGRTIEDLIFISGKLAKAMNIELELALNFVYIRIIDETWIGHEREINALSQIKKYLKLYGLNVEKTNIETDVYYGVDFEIKENKELIAGVQLKSTNYLCSKDKLTEIISITQEKNNLYSKKYNIPVIFLYINSNGLIMNLNDLYYLVIKGIIKTKQFK